MRIYFVLLCILIFSFSKGQDSLTTDYTKKKKIFKREDYIEDLSYMINVTPFVMKSITGFTLSGNRDIQYTPNEGGVIGVKLQHKWLGFAISYSPRKFQDENIGQSDYINLVLNSYGRKIGFDAYFLNYRGYLIENFNSLEKQKNSIRKDDPLRFRYDLRTVNSGFNTYYIFNSKKFSYRSTFLQNEWQKKSGGSFMLTASFNFYRINADSTIIPYRYDSLAEEGARLKSGDFYSFAIMPGYTHTFVLFKRLFLTLSPSLGLMMQAQDYKTEHDEDIGRVTLFPRGMFRSGLGFNSKKFYIGVSSITDVYNIRIAKGTQINNQINNFTLYVGIRLGVPKPLQKYSDFLGKCDPMNLLSIQLRK